MVRLLEPCRCHLQGTDEAPMPGSDWGQPDSAAGFVEPCIRHPIQIPPISHFPRAPEKGHDIKVAPEGAQQPARTAEWILIASQRAWHRGPPGRLTSAWPTSERVSPWLGAGGGRPPWPQASTSELPSTARLRQHKGDVEIFYF